MAGLPECFTKKQQMYHGNKSHLLKTWVSTPPLTSPLKKHALIQDFSGILSYQAAVATVETIETFADGIIKFVRNLSSGLFTY